MARSASSHPTELELEILKILWKSGSASVREVVDALRPTRPLAYTSVMTMMTIMVRKGYLKRARKEGRFVYRPSAPERTTVRRMLRDFVDRVFDGSAVAAALNLLQAKELDDEEIARLREVLDKRKKEA